MTFASFGQISRDENHADFVKEEHDPLKQQVIKGHNNNISKAPSYFPSPINIIDGSLPQVTRESSYYQSKKHIQSKLLSLSGNEDIFLYSIVQLNHHCKDCSALGICILEWLTNDRL